MATALVFVIASRSTTDIRRIVGRFRTLICRVSVRRCAQQGHLTTDSNHDLPIAPNLFNRQFTVAAPDTVWVGDITYIPTDEGWLFLAVVIDLKWWAGRCART